MGLFSKKTLEEAANCTENSAFIKKYLSPSILEVLIKYKKDEWQEFSSSYDKGAFEDKHYFFSL